MSEYRPELDGLRAIAILPVVLFHCGWPNGGFIGVDLFFVLSSFLITSILASEWRETGRIDLKRFYWRRFLRLMPALALMLAVYVALAPFIWPGYPHARDALLAGFYLTDFSMAAWHVPLYIGQTWSLAVEEQFYLIWPFVLMLVMRSNRPLAWLAAAFAALTLWRTSNAEDFFESYSRFDTHATGLVLGAGLYFSGLRLGRAAGIVALALFGAIVLMTTSFPFAFVVITPAELASAALIASAWSLTFLGSRPLVWIGKRSYAIYLWHNPIAYALRDHLPFAATVALTLALSICCALISWHTVEAWSRRMKSAVPALARKQVLDHAG